MLFGFLILQGSMLGPLGTAPLNAQSVGQVEDEIAPVRTFREFARSDESGLPQSSPVSLLVDSHGLLWIGTLGGLATYDGRELLTVEDPEGPGPLGVYDLVERPGGGVYAGSSEDVFVFDGRNWSSIPAPDGAHELVISADGEIFRRSRRGVAFRHTGETVENPWQEPAPLPDDGPTSGIGFLNDRLWLASPNRIYTQDSSDAWNALTPEVPEPISAIFRSETGRWWTGSPDGNLFHFQDGESQWQRVRLEGWTGGRIRTVVEDLRGRIWAGGYRGGLAFRRPDGQWNLWGPKNGLFEDGILDIRPDPYGSIWLSFNGRGLQQWIGEAWSHRRSWDPERFEGRVKVFGISGTADGGLLAAVFDRGLWYWDGQTFHTFDQGHGLDQDLRAAVEPEPGTIWAAGRFGVWEADSSVDPDFKFERTLELPHGFAKGFYLSPDGHWYLSTSTSGLYRRIDGQWQPDPELHHLLPDGPIRDLDWIGDELWVGVSGPGVQRVRDGAFIPWQDTEADALPRRVNAVLQVDDEVWV